MENETRIALLEKQTEHHQYEIQRLDNISQQLDKTLTEIQGQLNQIKWIGVGVGLTLLADNLGVAEIFKSILL